MTEAATTPDTSGSDSVRPSISLDDAADLNFDDPNQETDEEEPLAQSDSETDEADAGQETDEIDASETGDDETETEEAGEADEASTPEPLDDVSITIDGKKLTLAELKKGYFREADYTRQKQVVSHKEKQLEEMSARVQTSVNAIAEFLVHQIPAEPDPQLAMTDPAQFVQAKAMHEAAMAQVNALLSQAGEVKTVANTLTSEQRRELLLSENARLAEAFPQTATDEGRQKFFTTAAKAAKELGYSDDDIAKVVDHRTFALAYYADIGMRAEKAREKAKQKVTNVPPVAPQKARSHGGNLAAASRNREAMKRLARTGSLDDAASIDFD